MWKSHHQHMETKKYCRTTPRGMEGGRGIIIGGSGHSNVGVAREEKLVMGRSEGEGRGGRMLC